MNPKQLKFSLAVVINLLTAVIFGYYCFLGANFYTLGDKGKSIIIAVSIILLLIGTSLGAKKLKETKRNFKNNYILEKSLLVLFTVFMACSTYFLFSHYLVVSAQEKTIKSKLNDNINQAENIYVEYEQYVKNRVYIYSRQLDVAIFNKGGQPTVLARFGINKSGAVSLSTQKNIQIDKIKYLLLPPNFSQIKTNDSTWLASARKCVNDWEPISLVDVINSIETNTSNSLNQLVSFSKKTALNEIYPKFSLNPSLSFINVKNHFTTLGTPSPFSIVLAILVYFLMLLSYFITKRDSRGTGALETAKYEVEL
ncbi:hypothetical protein [Flavobacterium gilvum]|uniref:Uncharacterized protein n=1 Tax=Flavobacterium gilvum TaxID=1492737 RepID=A0AAC9I536_9FLAO|nr:hypothetical protein [Flavobacterium gilvum]AOW11019.1 hypothetical protein EM308_16845 [Flavobacterium gilvum]KFC59186.1 hypothetical protein FEM08_20470 [Flavobacterium gilvum]